MINKTNLGCGYGHESCLARIQRAMMIRCSCIDAYRWMVVDDMEHILVSSRGMQLVKALTMHAGLVITSSYVSRWWWRG